MERIISELGQIEMNATKKLFELLPVCAKVGTLIDSIECGQDTIHWYDVTYNQYMNDGEYQIYEHEGDHTEYRQCCSADEVIYCIQQPAMSSVITRYIEKHYRLDRALHGELDDIIMNVATNCYGHDVEEFSAEWDTVSTIVWKIYNEDNLNQG